MMRIALVLVVALLLGGGLMFWNRFAEDRVAQYEESVPRDPETGIMTGGEPRTVGPADTDKAVLFVHGFAGTPNSFHDLPDQVAAAGWHVHAMLLPGHGTTPREFAQTSPQALREAVTQELDALRERYDTVVLLGHSMGGALATLAAAETPVDALILTAPYYRITYRWYYVLRPETWVGMAAPLIHWVYRPPQFQPVNRIEARSEILSYTWIPAAGGRTAMILAAQAQSDRVLEKITMPTLLIHSKRDTVTDPTTSETVFEQLPAEDKDAVWLETSDHIIFWDFERRKVANEILTFLTHVAG